LLETLISRVALQVITNVPARPSQCLPSSGNSLFRCVLLIEGALSVVDNLSKLLMMVTRAGHPRSVSDPSLRAG